MRDVISSALTVEHLSLCCALLKVTLLEKKKRNYE